MIHKISTALESVSHDQLVPNSVYWKEKITGKNRQKPYKALKFLQHLLKEEHQFIFDWGVWGLNPGILQWGEGGGDEVLSTVMKIINILSFNYRTVLSNVVVVGKHSIQLYRVNIVQIYISEYPKGSSIQVSCLM